MGQVITNNRTQNTIGSSLVNKRLPIEFQRFGGFIPQNFQYAFNDFMPSSWAKYIAFNRWKKINAVTAMGLVTITNGFEGALEKLQVKGDPRRFFPNPFTTVEQVFVSQETPDYIQDSDKYTQLILSMEPFSI